MNRYLLNSLFILFGKLAIAQFNPASYVNPLIGTGGHGHTFPGAACPFGMVQLSPDTRIDDSWDGCGGYHYNDSLVYGFSHTHLSGTGCSDYGDIAVMPFMDYLPGEDKNTGAFNYRHYAQRLSHAREQATAGTYSLSFENGITTQLTATTRTGIHKYTFPNDKDSRLVIQLDHRDKTLESTFEVIDHTHVAGFRRSRAWAKDQYIYFVMEFSEPFTAEANASAPVVAKEPAKFLFQTLSFGKLNGKPLLVKVGISNVSIEGARKNLKAEAPHWDFEQYRAAAVAAWNKELQKIRVSTQDKEEQTIFYTALYHTMIQPNVAMDVDSLYRGRDNAIHKAKGFTYYTVFSLWDTFRAAHPLYTIIDKKRTSDFINTFIAQYEQGGRLPMWELSQNETDCMIGFHSVSVIADAVGKNIGGFDLMKAYTAMQAAATYTAFGIPVFNKNNYLQVDDEPESVSKTLEYAYDNWCIAQVAFRLKKSADVANYLKHAQAYKNVFDPSTGFMRPRKNGNWLSPFDPSEVNNHYTEANSWQYSFFVPQDVRGLIKLMGGDAAFEKKLDELFTTSSKTTGREQADITGLIGQYAHGNEPSHHMSYLYNYVGKPAKTQDRVTQIMREFYKNAPDGLIGNEDCGQMSAWFVMSAMGIYQVCPGSQEYVIGKPLYDSVNIQLDNNKTFVIARQPVEPGKPMNYITSVILNGKTVYRSAIRHELIAQGGRMVLTMAPALDSLNKYGKGLLAKPISRIALAPIITAPVIHTASRLFKDHEEVSIEGDSPKTELHYTRDGKDPLRSSPLYTAPFICDSTSTIKVKAYVGNDSSAVTSATIYKKPNHWTIQLNCTYNKQYTAGGPEGIIDGIRGDVNWRKGEWQGYQSQDFECVIDMGKIQPVNSYSADFLQDSRSWILFPVKVEFYISNDGKKYELMETLTHSVKPDDNVPQTFDFVKQNKRSYSGRYVKVKAYNFGKLPEWHQGAGGDAFIFIDEITIH